MLWSMPIRRAGGQRLLEVSHRRSVLAIVLAFAICGCSAGTTTGNGVRSKGYIPPDRYDAVIFFCPRTVLPADCPQPATPGDVTRVRAALLADDGVRGIAYLSEDQALALERQVINVLPQLLQPGDVPTSFSVALSDAGFPPFRQHYATAPGVEFVQMCTGRLRACDVAALRSVGALP
jgi:hypothetical protein